MKNYIKISIAICLALISNNTFANQQLLISSNQPLLQSTQQLFISSNQPLLQSTMEATSCCFNKFLTTTHTLQDNEKNILKGQADEFFGDKVSVVDGILYLSRTASQQDIRPKQPLIIDGRNNVTENNNDINNCEACIVNGSTMFIGKHGTLAMGSGSRIHIVENSKLLISGHLNIEPDCVINIGSRKRMSHNSGEELEGTGGYLIINAEEPINLTNLTINLLNKDSHLEIHGNDISLSRNAIHRYDDQATVHIEHFPFIQEFAPDVTVQNEGNEHQNP